jgi:hypothetical protein
MKVYKINMNDKNIKDLYGKNIESNKIEGLTFPIARKIAANTIGFDLVSVAPMSTPSMTFGSDNSKIISEVKSINRDRVIDSIVEDVEYSPMKFEDHPDYKPGSGLYYIDFKYGI